MKAYFLWLAKLVTVIVLFIFFIPALLVGTAAVFSGADQAQLPKGDEPTVSLIELKGMIENTETVIDDLHEQVANKQIKGIVLRIDSPGGAVGPSQELFEAVRKLKAQKPIVVSMGSLAASGGLYSALGASKIYAQPGTITGSIGVIMQVPNFTKISEKIGLDMVTVKSGALKDVGNTFRPMTDEERSFLEGQLNAVHDQFIRAVMEGRNLPEDKVRAFADGRVIMGQQAKELGLIDDFGDIHSAARAVFEILGEPLAEGVSPTIIKSTDKFADLKQALRDFRRSLSTLQSLIAPHTESLPRPLLLAVY
jgi:protease-4